MKLSAVPPHASSCQRWLSPFCCRWYWRLRGSPGRKWRWRGGWRRVSQMPHTAEREKQTHGGERCYNLHIEHTSSPFIQATLQETVSPTHQHFPGQFEYLSLVFWCSCDCWWRRRGLGHCSIWKAVVIPRSCRQGEPITHWGEWRNAVNSVQMSWLLQSHW